MGELYIQRASGYPEALFFCNTDDKFHRRIVASFVAQAIDPSRLYEAPDVMDAYYQAREKHDAYKEDHTK